MKQIILAVILIWGSFIFVFGDEEIIIGREDGDGLLVYPQQVGEGPDANIYVYDLADAFIKVFSPEGKFLRKIGGKGQEPGEIQRPDGNIFLSGLWGDEEQKRDYWLLDENGKTVAKISTQYFGIDIAKHFIFYRTRDEEENILIHCLKRTGAEKEDLLRLGSR
jgi:hypothetical protein